MLAGLCCSGSKVAADLRRSVGHRCFRSRLPSQCHRLVSLGCVHSRLVAQMHSLVSHGCVRSRLPALWRMLVITSKKIKWYKRVKGNSVDSLHKVEIVHTKKT